MAAPARASTLNMNGPQRRKEDEEKQGMWEALNDFVRPLDGLIETCAATFGIVPSFFITKDAAHRVLRHRRDPASATEPLLTPSPCVGSWDHPRTTRRRCCA